jgi:hypothetical protein
MLKFRSEERSKAVYVKRKTKEIKKKKKREGKKKDAQRQAWPLSTCSRDRGTESLYVTGLSMLVISFAPIPKGEQL